MTPAPDIGAAAHPFPATALPGGIPRDGQRKNGVFVFLCVPPHECLDALSAQH